MKRFFSTKLDSLLPHVGILLLRSCSGVFMLTHGYPKWQKLISGDEIQFADPFGLGVITSFILVVFAEFICSLLVIVGLATRFASLFIVITMLVAAFHAHAADPFSTKEKPLLYLLIFGFFLFTGAGRFSIDQAFKSRSASHSS